MTLNPRVRFVDDKGLLTPEAWRGLWAAINGPFLRAFAVVAGAGTISNSANVSSVTHVVGTGVYVVNLMGNFANAAVSATIAAGNVGFIGASMATASTVTVNTYNAIGVAADLPFTLVCFSA